MTLPSGEEKAFQTSSNPPWTKRGHLNTYEESSSESHGFSSLSSLKKLWDIVESDQFQSIWWDKHGKCSVIYEEQFKKEVLRRREPLTIFEIGCMKSFTCHLHLHRFITKKWDFSRSCLLNDSLEEAAARELLFYYNPHFRRGSPHLVIKCKRSFGVKK
ncbi:heat shock transcription factor, Y-linked-like [Gavia stellata]|uniref:heat shock transcription factor, Y-linked-like n=1 Tax=Gavia stellata TaxID=37040 RepID=UPI0028A0952C|nr:heat shock transcription factor, Y-linked-like [Gavia stellata]